jgi:hypothetical protein
MIEKLKESEQDFEWYPTTPEILRVIGRNLPREVGSIMDVGAGDGRALTTLDGFTDQKPELYSIEKSPMLVQSQPANIIPVGTDFWLQPMEQIKCDVIFSNPPYSEFTAWVIKLIRTAYCRRMFLVIPQRWRDNDQIQEQIKYRGIRVVSLGNFDFLSAEREARAKVEVIELKYPSTNKRGYDVAIDPFDLWFEETCTLFHEEPAPLNPDEEAVQPAALEKAKPEEIIPRLVKAFDHEFGRFRETYQAAFKLDRHLMASLGVSPESLCAGIKTRITGLKDKYWRLVFDRLTELTKRLTVRTRDRMVKKLFSKTSIPYTTDNIYAVVLWAIKNSNRYYDVQLVDWFFDLSTFMGVDKYVSNVKAWTQHEWRCNYQRTFTHYGLDYRIVVEKGTAAVDPEEKWRYHGQQGLLAAGCHELIDDTITVFNNLGFSNVSTPSREREWSPGVWEDFQDVSDNVLFQVKAHKNGNLHFRFMQDCIRAVNIEVGRILGWLKSAEDASEQLKLPLKFTEEHYQSNTSISTVRADRLLGSS